MPDAAADETAALAHIEGIQPNRRRDEARRLDRIFPSSSFLSRRRWWRAWPAARCWCPWCSRPRRTPRPRSARRSPRRVRKPRPDRRRRPDPHRSRTVSRCRVGRRRSSATKRRATPAGPVGNGETRLVLQGVPKIGFHRRLCPFPGSVEAALEFLGRTEPYDYLMGVSGAAFRRRGLRA